MQIIFHIFFKKKFKKLPKKIQNQFYKRLQLFENDKFNSLLNNYSVEKRFPNCRSINITGDYRVIFKEEQGGLFIFLNIGTHSELY